MDFNPRTATGIPTEPVVRFRDRLSCNRHHGLRRQEDHQGSAEGGTKRGRCGYYQRFEATGSPIITDGEQRVSSFATYPIAEPLQERD